MKSIVSLALFCLVVTAHCAGQSKTNSSKAYVTSGGELIFSFANIQQNDGGGNSKLRFSPAVNFQFMLNKDVSKNFGLFTGLALRNVGYIMDDYKDTANRVYKKKFRSYNIGIPVGVKIGNLEKTFFYAGYEAEFPISYKEKTFDNGDKIDKITGWFSNRQEAFQHGFLVGIQFPYATNLKFKYYVSGFHNRDFTRSDGVKPYAGLNSNIYYFSLCFFLFKNLKLYTYN